MPLGPNVDKSAPGEIMSILPGNNAIISPGALLSTFGPWDLHSLIAGANCFILQIPMLYLGFFTLDVHIITLGFASGNNVNVSGK